MDRPPKPDFDWYAGKSAAAKLPPRCPIASSELCPRYYSSRWLLGDAGVATKILEEDATRLDRKWEPFKPSVAEEEPSTLRTEEGLRSVSEFCPEVAFETFGYFASGLHRYADEIDRGHAEEKLTREGADAHDPRWVWAGVLPRHYTECREYSIFAETARAPARKATPQRREGVTQKTRWRVFARDEFTCQYCGRRAPEVVLEVDHRISVKEGGSNEMENLLTACQSCNRGKGSESSR